MENPRNNRSKTQNTLDLGVSLWGTNLSRKKDAVFTANGIVTVFGCVSSRIGRYPDAFDRGADQQADQELRPR
jgi:hypothetical protein